MYYVYVLQSQVDGQLYIGYTPDLKSRLKRHESGYVPATKSRRPLKLIYYESYLHIKDARRRETYLKGGSGHEQLKIQLENTYKLIKYRYKL